MPIMYIIRKIKIYNKHHAKPFFLRKTWLLDTPKMLWRIGYKGINKQVNRNKQ